MPSPTFSLSQVYETPRLTVTHFDFYRLASAEEARELGFDEALRDGAAIVEWPERAAGAAAGQPLSRSSSPRPPIRRRARVTRARPRQRRAPASRRIGELMAFLDGQPRWRGARIAYLQGDASTRSYARLFGATAARCC